MVGLYNNYFIMMVPSGGSNLSETRKARDAWRREFPARWLGVRMHLAMRCVAPGGFGCSDGLREGFYTALDGGLDVMPCWGPNYECNLYWGNTWLLDVVAWWFWRSSGVCKIVARTDGF